MDKTVKWIFSSLGEVPDIEGHTTGDVETFKSNIIDNLAREICQNSLDAKNKTLSDDIPVVVKFNLAEIKKKDHDLLLEYEHCLELCDFFWKDNQEKRVHDFINKASSVLQNNSIKILIASDYNTEGLTGSNIELTDNKSKSNWKALVNGKGISSKNDNQAGGSYGIGKNAPFACSDLSLVCYNTYAIDGKSAFEGIAKLATFKDDKDNLTHATGHYRKEEHSSSRPITPEIKCSIRDLCDKRDNNNFGTDIMVIGCDNLIEENEDWELQLEHSVIKNFLLALMNNQLIVYIGDKELSKDSIEKIIEEYRTNNNNNTVAQIIRLYDTYVSPDITEEFSIAEENDLLICFKADKTYKKEIFNFRTTGMLIGLTNRSIWQAFSAIVIVKGELLDKKLRQAEPPKHDKWDSKLVEDKNERKEVNKYIKDIKEKVKQLIDAQCKTEVLMTQDSGLGEYLPDTLDDLTSKKGGTDKLKPLQQIAGNPKKIDANYRFKKMAEKISKGKEREELSDEEYNPPHDSHGGGGGGSSNKDQLPIIDPSDRESTVGIEKINKSDDVAIPELSLRKIFAINYKQGLYKLLLKSKKECEKTYIEVYAYGEDGSEEKLNIHKCFLDGKPLNCNQSNIGPFKLVAEEKKELYITFDNQEKMVLDTNIWEVVAK